MSDAPAPGDRLGHFRLVSELGRGGFGVVFLADDVDIPGRQVAVKTLRPGVVDAEALRREASALAVLRHPNILVVHEVGESPFGLHLAAEFAPGGTLAARIARRELAREEVLPIARACADALASAHARGVVHRDFKPGNVLIDEHGIPKVADFGIALRSGPGTASGGPDEGTITLAWEGGSTIVGTPFYLAPEVLEGSGASPASDQFSFGVALHEMLAGRRPFDPAGGIRATLADPSIDASIPADLRRIVARCLAKDPRARFPDLHAVVEALDAAIRRRSRERRRLRRLAIAFAATLCVLAGGFFGMRAWRTASARHLNETGSAAMVRGDRDAAREAFVAAHSADPRYLPACANVGTLASLEASPTWAVTLLRDCAATFPEADVVHYNLGAALRATGDLAGAEASLARALDLAGRGPLRSLVVNEIARIEVARGRAAQALARLEGERPFPATAEGTILEKTVGLAALESGDPARATRALSRAIDAGLPEAQRPEAWVLLGRAHEALGRLDEARAAYAQALLAGATGEDERRAREGLTRIAR
ncbi:MAG TPA: protein kinase [Candidatus Polarisedimenticolaceae bacterium]